MAARLRPRRSAWWLVAALGVVAPYVSLLWVSSHLGPNMDTAFEFERLRSAPALPAFLEAVAEDNQPPLSMMVSWVIFHTVGSDFQALRIVAGSLALLSILALAAWGLNRPAWAGGGGDLMGVGSPRWSVAMATFGLLLSLSPAVAPVVPLLRYSTWMAVVWLGTVILMLKLDHKPSSRLAVLLGLILGLSLFISFSAVALVVAGMTFLAIRRWRLVAYCVLGLTPGLLLTVIWSLWAGGRFQSNVVGRTQHTVIERLTAAYENFAWVVAGPVSLPTPVTVVVVIVGWIAVGGLLVSMTITCRLANLLGLGISIALFGWAGLVNANMAGPTLVLLLTSAALVVSCGRCRATLVAVSVLAVVMTAALVLMLSNRHVLRPFNWANGAPQALELIESLEPTSPGTAILDFGDKGTFILIERDIGLTPYLPPLSLEALVPIERLIVLRGDERFKDDEWARVIDDLSEGGFRCVSRFGVAPYLESETRRQLGMYNVNGWQYRVYEFERVTNVETRAIGRPCDLDI